MGSFADLGLKVKRWLTLTALQNAPYHLVDYLEEYILLDLLMTSVLSDNRPGIPQAF